jgi:hypothetical protein|tara:strand:- start:479 stop:622 length:144 start_codon:yes stop_codon:yes gene_type:complete
MEKNIRKHHIAWKVIHITLYNHCSIRQPSFESLMSETPDEEIDYGVY